MIVGVHTLGCKLNQVESEAILDAFVGRGHRTAAAGEEADLHVVNTCTVTSKSEQKARRLIRRLAGRGSGTPILVTGCYAQLDALEIRALGPGVRVLSLDDKARLLDLPRFFGTAEADGRTAAAIDEWLADTTVAGAGRFPFTPGAFRTHTRALLKIQDGCDRHCAYCRVTLARGPSLSLSAEEVRTRALALADAGYREIVLSGVNIGLFRDGRLGLAELLPMLLEATPTVRYRLSSLEPEMVTPALAECFQAPGLCPHLHLSVQSMSNRVLAAMRRPYTRERVLEAVEMIREKARAPYLAADVITGFPGESEADFEDSRKGIAAAGFNDLHVFPFSPRPGTEAAALRPRVPERVSGERARRLRDFADTALSEFLSRQIGVLQSVIVEAVDGGEARGLSERYVEVAFPCDEGGAAVGNLVRVLASAVGQKRVIGGIQHRS